MQEIKITSLLNTVKNIIDKIMMQFGQHKCAKIYKHRDRYKHGNYSVRAR